MEPVLSNGGRPVTQSSDMVAELKERGFRLTPQRMMIVFAIENSDHHISADEIYAQVVDTYPVVNISTVYRTLELLKRLNLVTETDLGEGRVRYHPSAKGHHHHLVCQGCGSMTDLDGSLLVSLENALFEEYSFRADLRHLAILGRCQKCGI